MDIRIKAFNDLTLEELYTLLKLREEVFIMEQKILYPDLDGTDKDAYHIMIYEEDLMVAYARAFLKGVKYSEASIGRVATRPSHRGQGYGTPLMNEAISHLLAQGEHEIKISAQAYAQGYYEKFGFVLTEKDSYLEDTIPHVEMIYRKEAI